MMCPMGTRRSCIGRELGTRAYRGRFLRALSLSNPPSPFCLLSHVDGCSEGATRVDDVELTKLQTTTVLEKKYTNYSAILMVAARARPELMT